MWQNVTETSVVINVDSESRYNASVSSWTRLGDGGVLIYISFTTLDAGAGHIFKHPHLQKIALKFLSDSLMCVCVSEPFDPPQNITLVNVTTSSVTVLWHPPSEPNGIIVHYTILYSYNSTVTEQVRHNKQS